MEQYVGLDVSLKLTAICIVDVPDHARPPRPRPDGSGCQAGVGSRQSSGHSRFGN
jgi:hypothetical protein